MDIADFLPYVFILVLLICLFAYIWIDRTESRLNDLENFIAKNYDVLKYAKEELEKITDKIKQYDKCCNIVDNNQANWTTAIDRSKRNESDLIDLKNKYDVLNSSSVAWNGTTSLVNESSSNWNSAYTISRDNETVIKTLTNCCDTVDRSRADWDEAASTSVQNKNAIVDLRKCCNKVDESSDKWDQASVDSLANKSNITALQTCCKKVDDSSAVWDQASSDSLANKSAIAGLQTCCKKVDDSSNSWDQASVDSLANKSAIIDLQTCCKNLNDSSTKWDAAVTTSEENQTRVKRIARSLNTEHFVNGLYVSNAPKAFNITTSSTAHELFDTIVVSTLLDRFDFLILDDLFPKSKNEFTSVLINNVYIVQSNDMGDTGFTVVANERTLQYNQPTIHSLLISNTYATSSWCSVTDGNTDATKSTFGITIAKPKILQSIYNLFVPGTFGTAGGHNRALFVLEKSSYADAVAFSTKNGTTGFRSSNPLFAGDETQELPFGLFRESDQPSEMYVADSLIRQSGKSGPFTFDENTVIGFRYPVGRESHDEN